MKFKQINMHVLPVGTRDKPLFVKFVSQNTFIPLIWLKAKEMKINFVKFKMTDTNKYPVNYDRVSLKVRTLEEGIFFCFISDFLKMLINRWNRRNKAGWQHKVYLSYARRSSYHGSWKAVYFEARAFLFTIYKFKMAKLERFESPRKEKDSSY